MTYRCTESGDPIVRVRSRYVPLYPEIVDILDVYMGSYGECENPAHRLWVYANLFWRDKTMSPVLVILGHGLTLMGVRRYFKSYKTVWCEDPCDWSVDNADYILPQGSSIERLHPVADEFVTSMMLADRPKFRALGR